MREAAQRYSRPLHAAISGCKFLQRLTYRKLHLKLAHGSWMCNHDLEGIPNKAQAAEDTARGRSKPQSFHIVTYRLLPKDAFKSAEGFLRKLIPRTQAARCGDDPKCCQLSQTRGGVRLCGRPQPRFPRSSPTTRLSPGKRPCCRYCRAGRPQGCTALLTHRVAIEAQTAWFCWIIAGVEQLRKRALEH